MITLVPLCTMTLMLSKAVDAGNTPGGQRMVAEITSATVSGRLSGSVAGGGSADWYHHDRWRPHSPRRTPGHPD